MSCLGLVGSGAMLATGAVVNKSEKKNEMERALKGRSPEQQQIIKYFYQSGGCMSSPISDDEYESRVMAKAKSMDFKQKALDKIGLDESQVNEVNPIHFENYLYNDKTAYALRGKDGLWRSSKYQITWIFFSSTQVYLYQYTFNMDEDGKKESTEEYFYKDITSFSAGSDTIEKEVAGKTSCTGDTEYVRSTVEYNRFAIVVPGDKFYAAMNQNDYTEKAIKGMQAKLREKKG